MKYEDIDKLKAGDKVVVELDKTDIEHLNHDGTIDWIDENQFLGKLEDFQPAEKKIKMTVKEKKEFDELKECSMSFFSASDQITEVDYPNLFGRLFYGASYEGNNKAQLEFSRAWEKPSLIEVEKEKKYRIKLVDGYLVNVMGDWLTLKNKKDGDIFTQAELDEMQALQKFRAVDLNKCKEEVGK